MCQKDLRMKRKIDDSLSDFEEDDFYIARPTKRITMCHNTPKQAKDEKKKLMKTSKKKLKQMDHPESNLRRSVLVNNVYKRLQNELRQEKNNKYYGYAFNPKCPFGFGAGIREVAQRKRQARLEQVLSEKSRLYEKLQNSNGLDSNCDSDLESNQQDSCTTTNSPASVHCISEQTFNCDNIVSSVNFQPCDMSNSTDFYLSCDMQQHTRNNLSHHQQNIVEMDCSMEGINADQIQSCDNNQTDAALEGLYNESNITDSNEQHTVIEYDSENEEIDVCSCEDDEQLLSTAANGLRLQQQQIQCSNVVKEQSSCDYQKSIHQSDSVQSNMETAQQSAGAASSGNSVINFPPKEDSKSSSDICDNNNETDQRGYNMNTIFPFTGVENTSYPQGHIYQGISPFCHPLLSSPFYQGFLSSFQPSNSSASSSNPSVTTDAVNNYYNHQSYNPGLYSNSAGGFYQTELVNYHHNSNSSGSVHSNAANMVTCT